MKTPASLLLDRKNLDYRPLSYPIEDGLLDGKSVAEKLGIKEKLLYKTLVLTTKDQKVYVFLVPSSKNLDLKKAARLLGEKSLRLLPLSKLKATTGYSQGGTSPLAMKKLFPTYIYKEAKEEDLIYVSGGRVGLSLEISPLILEKELKIIYLDL